MPSGTPIPQNVVDYTMDLLVQGMSKSEIARVVGVSRFSVIRIIDAYAIAQRIKAKELAKVAACQCRHDQLVDSDP